jgi:Zn-dependent membrane protease YugP
MSYLGLIIISTIIGGGASWYVHHQIKKYATVTSSFKLTGVQIAQHMLVYNGVPVIPFHRGGHEQNHFDPRDNSITLDPHAYSYNSVTALATACHEAGHACQYAKGFLPMKIRSALVPVVNFASNTWMIALLLGIFMNMAGLVDLAIILFLFAVLFQLVTLPVEFDASGRALKYLRAAGMPQAELAGAGKVLRACALTYVAAALVSVLQLVWLIGSRD